MRRIPLLALLAAALLMGCAAKAAPEGSTKAGSAGLNFSAVTTSGAAFEGESLTGKPAVLWFWAPWCPTCRAQASGVEKLAQQYGDQVNVVGVGGLDEAAAIKGFADSVPGITQLTDPDGAVWRHFGVTAQSTYLVLDADGGTVASGYLDDDELARIVAGLAG